MNLNSSSILILNDYCLYKILEFAQFKDQIKFLLICKRFRSIYFSYIRTHKEITIDLYNDQDWATLDELQNAFAIIGPIIEEFKINLIGRNLHWFYECFGYVLNNCQNLKTLEIENKSIRTCQDLRLSIPDFRKHIENISEKLKILKHLKLNDLQVLDSDVIILQKLKNLESLDLSNHKEITGKYLEKFKSLKVLKLAKCCDYSCKNLIVAFENLTDLEHLDLEFCYQFNDHQIGVLIENCKNIEVLKLNITFLGGFRNFQRLHEFKNLKYLTVIESSRGTISEVIRNRRIFDDILRRLSKQLLSLKIYFSQYDNDKGMNTEKRFDAINALENLKKLHLDGFLQCNEKFWKRLEEFVKKSELKILSITYTNTRDNLSVKDLVSFLLSDRLTDLKFNLEIPGHMIKSGKFLKEMVEELNLFDYKRISHMQFTLWAIVEGKEKINILNKFEYKLAKQLFEIFLEDNNYEYYTDGKYHENEIYQTELNPYRIRRMSNPERMQEQQEILEYNENFHKETLENRSDGYRLGGRKIDETHSATIIDEHYSPEAHQQRKSLGKARITLSANLDENISTIKKIIKSKKLL